MLRTAAKALLESGSLTHAPMQPYCIAPVLQAAVQTARSARRLYSKQAQGEGAADSNSATGASTSGDEAAAAEAQASAADIDTDVAELQELLEKAQEEAAGLKDKLLRSHAEMTNLADRHRKEKENLQNYAVQKFAQSLLEVADNLESAAKAVPSNIVQQGADVPAETALKYLRSLLEGVQATERVLLKTMGSKGVQRIETREGQDFDPNSMEAMTTVPCTGDNATPGTIANVWQSGYKIHDRILRAAKVIVFQE